ncbi:type II toxin-antitoxin system RelE/ParE family toxin [Sphingobium sufflavum]|uniref:type II toxin-antitoxin system RelE/ParE family toxin n=1 Tax=Sphingobium sufflavum TaxID=1129547 RepID=UPI001F28C807|nr:type II toxin-antitoxin system RelE/ParE family toxin [Sphingobium sufflavum]MCE7798260.1 type II toxin-antitoxin system RelE/ParE family toxin [Sphingobium sufflavum]
MAANIPEPRRNDGYGSAVITVDHSTALPYKLDMQSVIETSAYLSAAKDAGMNEDERAAVIDVIASNPEAGEIMPGCGGARKLRVAKPGKGKSGGYRVITYFAGAEIPVFLLTVFGKNEKVSLAQGERNALATLTKTLKDSF